MPRTIAVAETRESRATAPSAGSTNMTTPSTPSTMPLSACRTASTPSSGSTTAAASWIPAAMITQAAIAYSSAVAERSGQTMTATPIARPAMASRASHRRCRPDSAGRAKAAAAAMAPLSSANAPTSQVIAERPMSGQTSSMIPNAMATAPRAAMCFQMRPSTCPAPGGELVCMTFLLALPSGWSVDQPSTASGRALPARCHAPRACCHPAGGAGGSGLGGGGRCRPANVPELAEGIRSRAGGIAREHHEQALARLAGALAPGPVDDGAVEPLGGLRIARRGQDATELDPREGRNPRGLRRLGGRERAPFELLRLLQRPPLSAIAPRLASANAARSGNPAGPAASCTRP